MKEKNYLLNALVAAVLGGILLIAVFVRTFAPGIILPTLDIPGMVLLSLIALLLENDLVPGARRCYVFIFLISAVTFALLPFAAGFAEGREALRSGLLGGIVFTGTTWLFTSIQERISTGPSCRFSSFINAVCLYLASQCFMDMIL